MRCTLCRSPKTLAIDTRTTAYGTRRRRRCTTCEHMWTTAEVPVSTLTKRADELSVEAIAAYFRITTQQAEALETFVRTMKQTPRRKTVPESAIMLKD